MLNIGEGALSLKGNKLKHYAIANGGAGEVRAALDTAIGCARCARHAALNCTCKFIGSISVTGDKQPMSPV